MKKQVYESNTDEVNKQVKQREVILEEQTKQKLATATEREVNAKLRPEITIMEGKLACLISYCRQKYIQNPR